MANFGRKRIGIVATVAPKAVVGAVYLSMMASQLLVWVDSSIASSQIQPNEEQLDCSVSEITELVDRLSQAGSSSAFNSLVQCGEHATQPLISVLNDVERNSLTRRLTARALSQIGSEEAIAALLSIAQQQQSEIRDGALRAIADIHPQARDAVLILINALQNEDEQVRTIAAYALGQLGENAREAVPALLERLDDSSANVRASTVYSLKQIAIDDPSVIRSIVDLGASDTDMTVLDNTAEALQEIPPTALPTLLEILAFDGDWREAAIVDAQVNLFDLQTLPQLTDEESLTLIPAILRRYSELPDVERASTIAYFSRQLTPSVISKLVAILEDENQDIQLRGNAAMAIGVADLESLLIIILEDENQDRGLRTDAATALGFTSGSPTTTASLIELLRSSDTYQAGLHLSNAESQEYLSSEIFLSEFSLIFAAFMSLLAFSDQDEVSLFLVQFEQENPILFDEMINVVAAGHADGPTMVRSLQERPQTPAICRVSLMQRVLWRCR